MVAAVLRVSLDPDLKTAFSSDKIYTKRFPRNKITGTVQTCMWERLKYRANISGGQVSLSFTADL